MVHKSRIDSVLRIGEVTLVPDLDGTVSTCKNTLLDPHFDEALNEALSSLRKFKISELWVSEDELLFRMDHQKDTFYAA